MNRMEIMKLKILMFMFCFTTSIASATTLEDVKILGVTVVNDSILLRLQAKRAPNDSYFFLDIVKSDSDSFEKLGHIINKLTYFDKYKLDLNIQSFSAEPSGSYYRSEGINFYGSAVRESVDVTPKNK